MTDWIYATEISPNIYISPFSQSLSMSLRPDSFLATMQRTIVSPGSTQPTIQPICVVRATSWRGVPGDTGSRLRTEPTGRGLAWRDGLSRPASSYSRWRALGLKLVSGQFQVSRSCSERRQKQAVTSFHWPSVDQTPLETGVTGAPLACPPAHKFLATAMLY